MSAKMSMKPGGGGRFNALKTKLANQKGVDNPTALAASIGRKKYGSSKMASFSAKGRKRAKSKSSAKDQADALRSMKE